MSECVEYNLTEQQSLAGIAEVLEHNSRFYRGVRVSSVGILQNDKWHNGIWLARGVPSWAPESRRQNLLYKNVALVDEWLSPDDLLERVKSFSGGSLKTDSREVLLGQNVRLGHRKFLASNNDYDELPGTLFEGGSRKDWARPGRLLKVGLPYYSDIFDAIRNWCELRVFHGDSDARVGGLLLFLPECRARFAQVERKEERIIFHVEAKRPEGLAGMAVAGAWTVGGRRTGFHEIVHDSEVGLSPPNDAEELEAFLFDDGGMYDFHRETRYLIEGHRRGLPEPASDADPEGDSVEDMLSAGEGETLEYKPYIDPGNPTKIRELIDTAVAFANTRGGLILMGVNDRCVPQGIERDVLKKAASGSDPEMALSDYRGKIVQVLRGAVPKDLPVTTETIKYQGHRLLLVRLAEGDAKPYWVRESREIFIRRGASNMRPHPDHELLPLFEAELRAYG